MGTDFRHVIAGTVDTVGPAGAVTAGTVTTNEH